MPLRIVVLLAKVSAIALTLLTVIILILFFSLQTGPVQKFIQNRINRHIPGSIAWNHLKISPVKGMFRIRGLQIRDPANEDIASLQSLEVTLSPVKLRRHVLLIRKLHCTELSGNIIADSSRQLNITNTFVKPSPKEEMKSETKPSSAWNIIAEDIDITIGNFSFRDSAGGINTGISDLSLSGKGDLNSRSGTIRLQIDSGWFSNPNISLPLSGLRLEGTLADDSARGFNLTVISGNTRIALQSSIGNLFHSPHGALSCSYRADLNEIDRIFNLQNAFSGIVSGEITASGNLENPAVTLSLDFDGQKIAGYPVNSIRGTVSLSEKVCTIPSLAIATRKGTISLSADADLREVFPGGFTDSTRAMEKLSGKVNLTVRDLVLSSLDTSYPAGILDLTLSSQVKGIRPDSMEGTVALSASVKDFSAESLPASLCGGVDLHAVISRGTLTIRDLLVRADSLTLDMTGSTHLRKRIMKADLNISAPDLSAITEPFGIKGLTGAVTSKVTVDGMYTNPEARISLRVGNLGFSDIHIGDVSILSQLSPDGTVTLEELTTTNKNSTLRVGGKIDLFRRGSFSLRKNPHLEVSALSDGIFLRDFIDSIDGTLTLDADVSGSPDSLKGSVRLNAERIATGAQNVRAVTLNASVSGDSLTLENLTVAIDSGTTITGSGYYTLKNRFKALIIADNLSLQSIDAIRKAGTIDGRLSFDAAGSGTVAAPSITGSVILSKLSFDQKPLQGFDAAFILQKDTVTLKGRGIAEIDALFDIKSSDFSGVLMFDSTKLAPLLALAGQKELSGLLDGRISARGNTHQIGNLTSEAEISSVNIRYRGMDLVSGNDIKAEYDSGTITIPGINLSILDSGHLSLSGKGSVDGQIGFDVDAVLPLDVAVPFVSDLPDLKGMLVATGSLSGTIKKPEYYLSTEVTDASFTIPVLEQSLSALNVKAVVDTGMLKIEHLHGRIGEGSFGLTGRAGHQNFRPQHLLAQLTCNNLPITMPEMLETHIDGTIQLTGDTAAAAIDGEIIILDGLYYKPVNLAGLFSGREKRRSISSAPDTSRSGFSAATTLNIAVKSQSTFSVDNNLASMELKPDVQIRGTLKKPAIIGRGEVTAGTVKWQNRDLVITRGIVDFLNPYETQATLDIASEINIRDWLIQLGITGTAPDDLTLTLSEKNGTPPLSDADIISVLATGRTTGELLGGEGGKTKEQLLASLLASEVNKRMQNGTLLDKVEIEAGAEGDPSGTRDIKVTVGKNISRRLTTLYSFETGSEGIVQRGSAEYILLERLLLSGFQDTEGIYGGALEWNLQWR